MQTLWLEPLNTTLTTELDWDLSARGQEVGVRVRGGLAVTKVRPETGSANRPVVWSVIDVLSLEDYLLSVTPSEAISSWADVALQVQAVAARTTYALHEMVDARTQNQGWDVEPSTWFQSYRGWNFAIAKQEPGNLWKFPPPPKPWAKPPARLSLTMVS